jgi:hypothetical protein
MLCRASLACLAESTLTQRERQRNQRVAPDGSFMLVSFLCFEVSTTVNRPREKAMRVERIRCNRIAPALTVRGVPR